MYPCSITAIIYYSTSTTLTVSTVHPINIVYVRVVCVARNKH